MRKSLFYAILIISAALFSCSGEEDTPNDNLPQPAGPTLPGSRTIIAYLIGDNNLSSTLSDDIKEMTAGSTQLPSDCNLVVFADFRGSKPYIAHIKDGTLTKVKEYENEFYSTSPDSMRNAYQWIIDHYPSREYATVLSGHGSGSIVSRDTISTDLISLHAYGPDGAGEVSATSTYKWMNVPSMAAVFNSLKDSGGQQLHFSYIFFDCCCFQTVEVAYELRRFADYIIAPVSETPGAGADYKEMVSVLTGNSQDVAQNIVSTYSANSNVCISAIRTDMLDALCQATRQALESIYNGNAPLTLDRSHCIYYYRGNETGHLKQPSLHDMKHIMKLNLPDSDYRRWLIAFENAVVSKSPVTRWGSSIGINFYDFQDYLQEEYYGGVSMLVPNESYTEYGNDINTSMFTLQWCNAVGWRQMGWDGE